MRILKLWEISTFKKEMDFRLIKPQQTGTAQVADDAIKAINEAK